MFSLENDRSRPTKWRGPAQEKRRQLKLLDGLECLPGQQDLPLDKTTKEEKIMVERAKTLTDYANWLSQTVWLKTVVSRAGQINHPMWFPVIVHQLKTEGRIMALVTPVDGTGEEWVDVERLRAKRPDEGVE